MTEISSVGPGECRKKKGLKRCQYGIKMSKISDGNILCWSRVVERTGANLHIFTWTCFGEIIVFLGGIFYVQACLGYIPMVRDVGGGIL